MNEIELKVSQDEIMEWHKAYVQRESFINYLYEAAKHNYDGRMLLSINEALLMLGVDEDCVIDFNAMQTKPKTIPCMGDDEDAFEQAFGETYDEVNGAAPAEEVL